MDRRQVGCEDFCFADIEMPVVASHRSTQTMNAIATLDTPYDDPEKESLRQKTNELINTLRR